jgi:hypothetical protein
MRLVEIAGSGALQTSLLLLFLLDYGSLLIDLMLILLLDSLTCRIYSPDYHQLKGGSLPFFWLESLFLLLFLVELPPYDFLLSLLLELLYI